MMRRSLSAERRHVAALLVSGAGLLLVNLAYLAVAYLPRYYTTPKLHLNKIGSWPVVGAGFALALLVGFGSYITAWRAAMRLRATPGRVVLVCTVAGLAGLLLLLSYPLLSDDLFYSIFSGRILAYYGQNPFVMSPADFQGDPLLRYSGWQRLTTPYGPLWSLISGGLSWLAGDNVLVNIVAFKAVLLAAFLIATGVIAVLLYRLHPARVLPGLVLWAWNPLILLDTAGNGHNSVIMVALILLGCGFAIYARPTLALVALTLAVTAQYAAIVVLPLVAIYLVREHRDWRAKVRALLPGAFAVSVVTLALFAPFWAGWRALGFLSESRFYYGSPLAVARIVMRHFDILATSRDTLLRGGALLVYVMAYPWLLREASKGAAQLLRAAYAALLLVLCVWPFFMPWYVLWVVALAATLGVGGVPRQALVFSLMAAVSYLYQYSLRLITPRPVEFWSIASAITVFAPLLLLVGWSLLPRAWRFVATLRGRTLVAWPRAGHPVAAVAESDDVAPARPAPEAAWSIEERKA